MERSKTWIVGYGDIARRLVNLYSPESLNVSARSEESLIIAKKDGQTPHLLDLDKEITQPLSLYPDSHLYYFVPPPGQGRKDTRLENFLQNLSTQPKYIVLISTTGVYGDCHGDWVDESRQIKPVADRAYRRADAEQQVIQWAKQNDRGYTILRVPGIYAEDRLPLARLKKGLPIVKEAESPWTNRIHADDLAMICYKAMQQQATQRNIKSEIYNVSDGHPSTMAEYFNRIADYAQLARPPQISLQQAQKELSKGMMSYMKESRRISNKKVLQGLGIELRYPSITDCLKTHT